MLEDNTTIHINLTNLTALCQKQTIFFNKGYNISAAYNTVIAYNLKLKLTKVK